MARPRKKGHVVSDTGKTLLPSYNISIGKSRTSVRLAPEIYAAIQKIAAIEQCSIKKLFEFIASTQKHGNGISTAIKVFAVQYFMAAATKEGHRKAGHGSLIETGLIPRSALGDRPELAVADAQAGAPRSPSELAEIGQLLYGSLWKSELAEHLGVSRQTVTRWAGGTHRVPESISADLHRLVRERYKQFEEKLFVKSAAESGR
jgi:predicted DNA-binding ribbon-helix-helix protein/DNA-binding transcriptional regulator YiaG